MIPGDCPRTDDGMLPANLRRENGASLLVADSRRVDENIREIPTNGSGLTPSFPWKCTRTRRQAICEVREQEFTKNGVTLKYFRKYLL